MKDFNKSEELPEPWYWTEQDLTNQAGREIGRTHVLYGKELKTLARRQDNDDVLFHVDNEKFAVVHLTWSGQRHGDNRWPTTEIFENWDDLYKNRILVDKADFE